MATLGKMSICVLEYHTSKSVVSVQRAVRAKCTKDPPTDKITSAWYSMAQIIGSMKNIDAPTLMPVWQELEYRIDVCCVAHGAHIEHL